MPRLPDDATRRLLLAAVIGLALFLLAGVLSGQPLPDGARLDPRVALDRSQAVIGATIGDYTLYDGDGRAIRLAAYRGKPLVVSFVYTGCAQVCPTTTRFLARAVAEAQRTLSPGALNVITVGFNQPFDTSAAMRDFQTRQGVTLRNWSFLAGDRASVEGLARDLGFTWAPTAGGFDHVTQVTILDGRQRVYRQVYGDTFELAMFVGPLRDLVKGEPQAWRSLGDLVERVRILCTVYDPRAGRYRLDYALFIEIFAGLTMLGGTAWYLTAEWRRHRSAAARARAAPFAAR